MKSIYRKVLNNLQKSGTLSYILKVWLVGYVSRFILLGLLYVVAGESFVGSLGNPGYIDNPPSGDEMILFAVLALVVAPLLETFVYQFLIIHIGLKITKNRLLIILASAIIFAVTHETLSVVLIVAFPLGVILAASYMYKLQKSKWLAFWTTAAIHFLLNLIPTLLLLVS